MPAQIKLIQERGTTLINLAVATLIIAALYVGREIFVPMALAVLLSFVLAPFAIKMQSWRIPRTLSVLVVVFLGFSVIFSLGGLMVSQATRLAGELPGYQQTLKDKIDSIRGLAGGSSTLERASSVLKELKTELENSECRQSSQWRQLVAATGRQTDPRRSEAARSRLAHDFGRDHRTPFVAVDHHQYRRDLCRLHSFSMAGSTQSICQAGRIAGYPAHNGSAR